MLAIALVMIGVGTMVYSAFYAIDKAIEEEEDNDL